MSPNVLAHLLKLQRQTARWIADDNRERTARDATGRKTNASDFHSPLAQCKWHRP